MKLKTIASITSSVLVVLVAILLFSDCREKRMRPTLTGDNVVILRMDLPGTKTRASIESPVTSTVVPGLQKVDIYLYDKSTGIVYSVTTLNASELVEAAGDNGLQITNLHANVNAISVICNDTPAKDLNIAANDNISELFGKNLDIELEQVFDNLTYIGKDETLVQVETPAGGSNAIDYFNASVVVAPLVARVEVSGITCTNKGAQLWTTLLLHSVYLENIYASGINLDYLENAPTNPVSITEVTEVQAEGSTQYWWLEILEAPNDNALIDENPWSPTYDTPATTGVFAFHIFKNNSTPTLGLQIAATAQNTGTSTSMYVRFNTYTNASGNITSFEPGNIYKISPQFIEDKVVTHEDEPGEIILSITVQEWTIHDSIIATS